MRLNTVDLGIDNYDDTILIIMVLGGAVAGTHYRLNIRAGAPLHTTQPGHYAESSTGCDEGPILELQTTLREDYVRFYNHRKGLIVS